MKTYLVSKYKVEGIENKTITEMLDYLKNKTMVGLDIETSSIESSFNITTKHKYKGGLDPYLSRIVMLQLGDINSTFVIDVRDFSIEELEKVIDYLDWNDSVTFVGVYLKFEGKHLLHNYNINLKKIHDCYIVDKILYNGERSRKYSLAHLSKYYLDIKPNSDLQLFIDKKIASINERYISESTLTAHDKDADFFIDKSTRLEFVNIRDKKFTSKQINYGSDDIQFPLLIKERQDLGRKFVTSEGKIEIYNPTNLLDLENKFSSVLAKMELNGLPFDRESWVKLYKDNCLKYEQYLNEINSYVVKFYPEFSNYDLFNPNPACIINWGVVKDVSALFKASNILPYVWSAKLKRKVPSLSSKSLLPMCSNKIKSNYMKSKWIGFEDKKDDERLILGYLLLERMKKLTTSFGVDFLKNVHPLTGRIHTEFVQLVKSGRQSSRNPNLQQIPNSSDFRNCFTIKNTTLNVMVLDNGERVVVKPSG